MEKLKILLFQVLQMAMDILESLTFQGIKNSSSFDYGYILKNLWL